MTQQRSEFDGDDDQAALAQLLNYMRLDRWAGGVVLRGQLPTVPNRAALPAASADYRGQVCLVLGAAGVTDTLAICLKAAANTYSWVTIVTGG